MAAENTKSYPYYPIAGEEIAELLEKLDDEGAQLFFYIMRQTELFYLNTLMSDRTGNFVFFLSGEVVNVVDGVVRLPNGSEIYLAGADDDDDEEDD